MKNAVRLIMFQSFLHVCRIAPLLAYIPAAWSDTSLAVGQDIEMQIEADENVHVGEPFEYTVRVTYKPDTVKPDFNSLIRSVRFVPFEQLQSSRPAIAESSLGPNEKEYRISYPISGINVLPRTNYKLDPLRIPYLNLRTENTLELITEPRPIYIAGYYPAEDITDIPFQPIKGMVPNFYEQARLLIIVGAGIFLVLGAALTLMACQPIEKSVTTKADHLKERHHEIGYSAVGARQKILAYENIFLSLIALFRNRQARDFWTKPAQEEELWSQRALKENLAFGYTTIAPDDSKASLIHGFLDDIFGYLGPDIAEERRRRLSESRDGLRRRIGKRKGPFSWGVLSSLAAVVLGIFFLMPKIWMNEDVVLYNKWIESLPDRMFAQDGNGINLLDVEMLGHLSEQQKVLERLVDDEIKGRYLYNYGTIVSMAYAETITGSNEKRAHEEEEEPAPPPSFEFPVQLLSNSIRYFPYDEDARRNLELAIMWREREDNEEADEVQGEVGPPLPGFSRDLNPLLF